MKQFLLGFRTTKTFGSNAEVAQGADSVAVADITCHPTGRSVGDHLRVTSRKV